MAPDLRVALRAALICVLVALFAAPSHGQVRFDSGNPRDGLIVQARGPWLGLRARGWSPLWLRLTNQRDEDVEFIVTSDVEPTGGSADMRKAFVVPAGSVREVEVLVPTFSDQSFALPNINVRGAGRIVMARTFAAGGYGDLRVLIAVVGATERAPSTIQGWTEQLTDARGALSSSRGITSKPHAVLITPDEMPTTAPGWSAISAVVVLTDDGTLAAERVESLMAWVRTGGTAIFVGADAEARMREHGAVGDWIDDRFARTGDGGAFWAAGLGRVIALDDASAFESASVVDRVAGVVANPVSWTPGEWDWPHVGRPDDLTDSGTLPRGVIIIALLVCAFLLGPVCDFVARRKDRPVLLLLIVPSVAIVCSLVLLGIGIARQGFELDTSSSTVTVLDQRAHRASTAEQRILHAGSLPGDGFTPDASTLVVPRWATTFGGYGRSNRRYRVDEGVLSGHFLPVRQKADQVILTDRPSRERLVVRPDGEGVVIENGLSTDIEYLAVNVGGTTFVMRRDEVELQVGESRRIDAADSDDARRLRSILNTGERQTVPLFATDVLPEGAWVARVTDNVFSDDCGLTVDEIHGAHVIFGLLEDDAR